LRLARESVSAQDAASLSETTLLLIDPQRLPRWEIIALTIALAGGSVYLSLAIVRIFRLKRALQKLQPAPADVQAHVAKVAGRLGLRRFPTLWLAPGRIPPMLWTLGGRALVVVPSGLWPNLNTEQQTALLAHELAHLKRKDHWVRWLDLTVAGLYWWHPVVWWARRGMREAEEQCCDAWAVWVQPQGSRTLARALLASLEFISGEPTTGVAATAAVDSGRTHVSFLKRRMRMIVQASTRKTLSWAGRLGVLGLSALILPLAPTWSREPDSQELESGRDSVTSKVTEKPQNATRQLDNEVRQDLKRSETKAEADDDDDHKEIADHLEHLLKDLGEKLRKDLGPVGEEVIKTLDKAAQEVSAALEKEGIISKDLRQALETARDELHQAFKEGGPLDKQARDAVDKAREDMSDAVEKARQELHEAVRGRAEKAKETARAGLRRRSPENDQEPSPEAEATGDLEQARKEVRQMEQELRRAMRRLEAVERREQRLSREPRRGTSTPQPERAPAPPRPPVPPHPPMAEGPEGRAEPPPGHDAPTLPEPVRPFRAPGTGPSGMRGPAPGEFRRPGMAGPGTPPLLNPRVERRLRELEEKMDRLLKELENLKGEKKEKELQ
jgi:beta-lactamase regulating signal transducer with metallopeptidase domain